MNVAILAAIPAHTGLLAWPEARGCRTLPSTEADLSRVDAWLGLIGRDLCPWTPSETAAFTSASIIRD